MVGAWSSGYVSVGDLWGFYAQYPARIQQEILQHLAAAPGTRLEVSIEIQPVNAEGFSTETVRTVRENAATLHFDANGFAED